MDDDLAGRTFLVTGANTGIGRATARHLAGRRGRVVLAGRSRDRTLPVLDEIAADVGADHADFVPLDLADLDSVRSCARQLLDAGDPIHVLINNAGVGGQRGATKQGFELAFGINHLGHFLLTCLLLDHLRSNGPARIVNVASDAHFGVPGVDFEAVQRPTRSITGMREYGVSKLCNVAFTQELSRRLDPTSITAYALHPGVIASDIWRRVPWPIRPIMTWFMSSADDGARTTEFCATAPQLAGDSGGYYEDCEPREPSPEATPELGAELWRRSAEWTGLEPARS